MNENGQAGKPFLLPQKDVEFYERSLFSFNIPEFINEKVDVNIPELEKLLEAPAKKVVVKE